MQQSQKPYIDILYSVVKIRLHGCFDSVTLPMNINRKLNNVIMDREISTSLICGLKVLISSRNNDCCSAHCWEWTILLLATHVMLSSYCTLMAIKTGNESGGGGGGTKLTFSQQLLLKMQNQWYLHHNSNTSVTYFNLPLHRIVLGIIHITLCVV